MIAPTNVQTIIQDGKPAFVVIPYHEYVRVFPADKSTAWVPDDGIPHEVVRMTIGNAMTLARAWREYLGLTQEVVAARMGISQSALAQMEIAKRPRRVTLEKLAAALGIGIEQLR
jgi:ribosome-binding protein aMBF1 (putative translation factor)